MIKPNQSMEYYQGCKDAILENPTLEQILKLERESQLKVTLLDGQTRLKAKLIELGDYHD